MRKPILSAVIVAGLCAGVSVALGWGAWRGTEELIGTGLIAQAVAMMLAVALTWGLYSALAYKLRLVNIPQLRAFKRGGGGGKPA